MLNIIIKHDKNVTSISTVVYSWQRVRSRSVILQTKEVSQLTVFAEGWGVISTVGLRKRQTIDRIKNHLKCKKDTLTSQNPAMSKKLYPEEEN